MVRVIGRVAEHYEVEEAKFARFRGGIPRGSWRAQMRQEDDLEKVGRYRPYARLRARQEPVAGIREEVVLRLLDKHYEADTTPRCYRHTTGDTRIPF